MILANSTWQDVRDANREMVVLIPTGSLEQHGPHLPLFTDSLLATAVCREVESKLQGQVLLVPTLWLGASGHHLSFPGTLSNSFSAYMGAIQSVIESLVPHGFAKFYIINGHGGNNEPNGLALRELKDKYPTFSFGASTYFSYAAELAASIMEGPLKGIKHACEAEASLMLYLHPDLVRKEKLRDDGLMPEPPITGAVHRFDEITEEGSFGFATYASAEKGKLMFEAAVAGCIEELSAFAQGYVLRPIG